MTEKRKGAGWRITLAALAGLAIAGCAEQRPEGQAAGGATLYRGFTLIDGTGGAAVPDAAMLVEDGRVRYAGPAAGAPSGGTVQDLGGKYVMPGIIDLHVHIGTVKDLVQEEKNFTPESVNRDLATYASFGVTSLLSMGTDKDSIFDIRRQQREGRPDRARVWTTGQGINFKGGYGGVPGINKGFATPEEATAEVDRQAAKGADFIKLWMDDELGTMPKMPYAVSKAVIDAAHRHKLRALAHVFYLADAKALVDQGIDGFVHMVRDQPIDDALIQAMKARGVVQFAPTLSREAAVHAFGRDNPLTQDPLFRQAVSPAGLAKLESPEREKTIAGGFSYPRLPQIERQAVENLRRLAQAGVTYGFGTDAGPPGRLPGYSEHWELEQMVRAGLTPARAIAAATGDSARILGANELGTLQPGKWADFVVLDADPLADIRNSRTIRAVHIAGRQVPSVKR